MTQKISIGEVSKLNIKFFDSEHDMKPSQHKEMLNTLKNVILDSITIEKQDFEVFEELSTSLNCQDIANLWFGELKRKGINMANFMAHLVKFFVSYHIELNKDTLANVVLMKTIGLFDSEGDDFL